MQRWVLVFFFFFHYINSNLFQQLEKLQYLLYIHIYLNFPLNRLCFSPRETVSVQMKTVQCWEYCSGLITLAFSEILYSVSPFFFSRLICQFPFYSWNQNSSFQLLSTFSFHQSSETHSPSFVSYGLSSGHLIGSHLQMVLLNTTSELTPSRSTHHISPFSVSLLSVAAVLLPTQIQTNTPVFMLQSPAQLQ